MSDAPLPDTSPRRELQGEVVKAPYPTDDGFVVVEICWVLEHPEEAGALDVDVELYRLCYD